MMEEPVITVKGISKKYYLESQASSNPGLLNTLLLPYRMLKGISLNNSNDRHFWALKDISFNLFKGERIGIIGRNGAGKSTLLKILSRLVYPTEGEARIKGRVTSLLEIGTGFNANFTGKENIYFNASMYGLTKSEINEKYDDIVEFSELKSKFINMPVKYYSSGMYMRLAFSVAAHLDPDILMLDEVLAVGDMKFSQKCLKKVENMTGEGQTVVFVSHGMGDVLRFCDKVIWLEDGRAKFIGDVVEGVELYRSAMAPAKNEISVEHRTERKGTGHAQITKIGLYNKDMEPVEAAVTGQDIIIVLNYRCDLAKLRANDNKLVCALYLEDERANRLFGMHDYIPPSYKPLNAMSEGRLICKIKRLPLLPGHYNLSYTLTIGHDNADKLLQSRGLVVLEGDFYGSGRLPHVNGGPFCLDYDWTHESTETINIR